MNPSAAGKSKQEGRSPSVLSTSYCSSGSEWLSGRVFMLMLAFALGLAFPKVLLGFDTFFYRDFGFLCYPQAFYQRMSLLRGEIPLWNPYVFCGVPYMAQWGSWYPSYFLNCLFPMPWSANFFQVVHLFLAGSGMYWLTRRWGVGSFAAAFAGFAYVFNGVTLSCLMWISYTAFLAWCPWVLGCTVAAWRNGGRWVALAAFTSAMQVLAGVPEMLLLFWGLVGLLWLRGSFGKKDGGNALSDSEDSGAARHLPAVARWRSLGRLAGVVALAAGITMVQMLPFFDLLAHSQRDRSFAGNQWPMPRWGWANLILPFFHCYKTPFGTSFQPGQYLISSYYLGTGVLVLAITGAWLTRRRAGAILGGLALFCWLLALGAHSFLFECVRGVFPWIGIARYPVKFALFPVVLVPLLAAAAIDKAVAEQAAKYRRAILWLGCVTLCLIGAVLWSARISPLPQDDFSATTLNAVGRGFILVFLLGGLIALNRVQPSGLGRALQIGLLALLPLDAFTHVPKIFPAFPKENLAPGLWTAHVKQPPPGLGQGRAMTSPEAARYLDDGHGSDLALDFTGRRLGEWYSLNLLDQVPKADGALILCPAYFYSLWRNVYQGHIPFGQGLLDLLSVRWYSSADNPLLWSVRTNFLAMVTGGQRPVFLPDAQVLQAICSQSFDPRNVVYLPESERSLVSVTNRTRCSIAHVRFATHSIQADVEAAEKSIVVFSQSYYHLWRLSVDGEPVPLLRADLAFQAFQVPAGTHHVELVYKDNLFRVGALLSLISLAACVLVWVRWPALTGKNSAKALGL